MKDYLAVNRANWDSRARGQMVPDGPFGEVRLADGPQRLPAPFTLIAACPADRMN